MAVTINKGVPLPERSSVRGSRWPWREMNPSDSFFAAGYVQAPTQRVGKEPVMNTSSPRQMCPGTTWATRLVTENGVRGVRVWRMT